MLIQLFGYDFMMTDDLQPLLIEVNTNPCLETESSPLLSRLISQVVDQTFKYLSQQSFAIYRVTVDPFFDGSEWDIGQSQEYPCSEVKIEMIACRQLRLTKPDEDERTQYLENSQHLQMQQQSLTIHEQDEEEEEPTKSEKGDIEYEEEQ